MKPFELPGGYTNGPWSTGHLCRPDHSCECRYIFGNNDRMGAVATVYVGNGDDDHDPPKAEAIQNQILIALAPAMADEIRRLEALLAERSKP